MNDMWLATAPLWLVGVVFVLLLLAALELGYRFGVFQRHRWPNQEVGGGTVVQSALLALLGLMLAFTYGASVSRFEARKTAVIDEANALTSAFNIAGMLGGEGEALRHVYLNYTNSRLEAHRRYLRDRDMQSVLARSLEAQDRILPAVDAIVANDGTASGPMSGMIVSSMNAVLNVHTLRLAAIRDRLPGAVIWLQLMVAGTALAVAGFNTGLSVRISRWRILAFCIVIAAVMVVILDFDRSADGFIQVSQLSLEEAAASMSSALTTASTTEL